MVELMPYIEANNLYSSLDRKQGWQAPANRPIVSTALKLFRCPSDKRAGSEYANITSYVGVAGAGGDAPTLSVEDARAGIFGYAREVKLGDIKDGTSNTLLLIETASGN